MTVYQARRAGWLWLPLTAVGALIQVWSYTQTLTLNGATLLGMGVMTAGVLALAADHDRTHTSTRIWEES